MLFGVCRTVGSCSLQRALAKTMDVKIAMGREMSLGQECTCSETFRVGCVNSPHERLSRVAEGSAQITPPRVKANARWCLPNRRFVQSPTCTGQDDGR